MLDDGNRPLSTGLVLQRAHECGDTRQSRIDEAAQTRRALQEHVAGLSESTRGAVFARLKDQGFLFIAEVDSGPVSPDRARAVMDLEAYVSKLPNSIALAVVRRLIDVGYMFPEERRG